MVAGMMKAQNAYDEYVNSEDCVIDGDGLEKLLNEKVKRQEAVIKTIYEILYSIPLLEQAENEANE